MLLVILILMKTLEGLLFVFSYCYRWALQTVHTFWWSSFMSTFLFVCNGYKLVHLCEGGSVSLGSVYNVA